MPQSWRDAQWAKLERNSGHLKDQMRAGIAQVEAQIKAMQQQLDQLKTGTALGEPVSQSEREQLRQQLFRRVREERWWVWDPATGNDWQSRVGATIDHARTVGELARAEAYMQAVSGCFQTRNQEHAGPTVAAATTALQRAPNDPDSIARARRHLEDLKARIDSDCRACLEAAGKKYG
jgi:hypothetical protein